MDAIEATSGSETRGRDRWVEAAPFLACAAAVLLSATARAWVLGPGPSEVWGAAMFVVLIAVGVWLGGTEPRRRARLHVLAISGAVYLAGHAWSTGGTQGAEMTWVIAFPFLLMMIAGRHPPVIASGGGSALLTVIVLLAREQQPPLAFVEPILGLLLSTGLAAWSTARFARATVAELEAERGRARAVEALDQVERSSREARRLAGIGRLAGSIGHEIANPINYVLHNLEFARARLGTDGAAPEVAQALTDAQFGARRVADIVDELRDSARTSAARGGRSIDPRRVVDRSVRLIENELRHRARLSVTLEPVPRVVADPGAIQQLVVAVLAETVATLPTGEGKRPSAHVRLASADPGAVRLDIQLGGARAGALDGTTRALAGELGAQVGWSDTPGGSCVTVTWPAAAPGPEDTDPMLMGRGVERLRRPRVLVVDDDEFVGYAFARGLEQLYEVEIAASGESALERLRHARFDAIVSDLWMPGMTGMQFYSALCEAHPWMRERIVFVTGAASDPDADAFLAGLARPALEKPCGVRDLQAAVAAIVGGGTTPTPEPCTHEARDRAAGA